MIRIRYNNIYAYCEGSPEELSQINLLLTYPVKGARYIEAYKRGKWDGKATMFHSQFRSFPSGLINYVVNKLPHIEFELECRAPQDVRKEYHKVSLYDKGNKKLKLRDYQEESIQAFLKEKRGIIKLATRSGKTVIGVACAQAIWEKTLFVVHTKDLLNQTIREFEDKLHIKIGKIGESVWEPDFITVATIQTLSRGIKEKSRGNTFAEFLKSVKFAIFDEVHRASSTYQLASRLMTNAEWRLGLSATALIGSKENKLQSMALTGSIIYEVKAKKLLDDRHIAKPVVTFIEMPQEDDLYGDWDTIYTEGIINNELRNNLICLTAIDMVKNNINPLILVEKKEHGRLLEDMVKNKIKIKYVYGQHSSKERKCALDDLQIGNLDAVISTRIFNEGINIPTLKGVIVASGYKSPVLSYQRYGRGITRTPEKTITYIVDFIDNSNSILHNHSLDRLKICERDKAFDTKIIKAEDLLEKGWGKENVQGE